MNPYYIQRGRFDYDDNYEGIDKIVYLNYMGNAEYEYGALPESLNNIQTNIDNYILKDVVVNGKKVTVFVCNENEEQAIIDYLLKIVNGCRLREPSDFDNFINDSDGYVGTQFWWDIRNHLMFWMNNEDFKRQFCEVMNIEC